jgi:hypothetical protein
MIGGRVGGVKMITTEQEDRLRKIVNELKSEFSAVSLCVLENEKDDKNHVYSLYLGTLPNFAYILKQLDRHFHDQDAPE